MNMRTLSACLTALAATNCASLPAPPENDGISVDLLVDAVQCELASVYENNRQFSSAVRDWVVNVTLTLKVTDETESRPTVTITPVISPGTLTLVVGPDFNDQSQRIAEIQFDVHMRDLDPKKRSKSRNRLPPCIGNTGLPQAENSLGLGRWMSTIATAAGRPDFAT